MSSTQTTDDTSWYSDTTTTAPYKSMATECLPIATIQCDEHTDKHTNSSSAMSSQADFSSAQEVSDSEVWCCGIRKRRRPKGYRSLGKPSKSDSRSPFNRLTCQEKKTFIDLVKEPVARSFGVRYDQLRNTESSQSESETDSQDDISENTSSFTESKCDCDHSVPRPENYCLPQVVTNQFKSSCYAAQHNNAIESYTKTLNISSNNQELKVKKDSSSLTNNTTVCDRMFNDSNSYLPNYARYSYESSGLAFVAKAAMQPIEFAAKDDFKPQYHCLPAPHTNSNYGEGNMAVMQNQNFSSHTDTEPSHIGSSHESHQVNKTAACSSPEINHPDSRHSISPDISETIQVSEKLSGTVPGQSAVFPWMVQGCGSPFKGGLVASSRTYCSKRKVKTQIKVGQRLRIVPKSS